MTLPARSLIACQQCSDMTPHLWHPAYGRWICCECGLSQPWDAEALAQRAEDRTSAIALPVAPAPVLKGDS